MLMLTLVSNLLLAAVALSPGVAAAHFAEPGGGRFVADGERTEKRPWIGVSVSPAPASLRHQLKVNEGVGLVVEFVQPGSPAEAAGIRPFDLLVKLDDQWLINPEQFAVLIRMHRAGDEVKLTCLREGSERAVPLKLIEHEVAAVPEWDGNAPWPSLPPPPPRLRLPRPSDSAESETIITWLDDHRQMSVVTTGGRRTLQVKENGTGRVLFDGPIDTDAQRAQLPVDIRRALEYMTRLSSEFEARHGGPATQPTEPRPSSQDGAAPHEQSP